MTTQTWERWCDDEPTVDDLVERFERLIYSISRQCARSYSLTQDDRDDLVQSMFVKLLAIPEDKRAYPGYVKMAINNAVRTGLRQVVGRGATPGGTWRESTTTDYDSAVGGNQDDEFLSPVDYLGSTPCSEAALVDSLSLDAALATLTPRERLCVDVERPTADIADELEVTISAVHMARKKVLGKLHKALTKRK